MTSIWLPFHTSNPKFKNPAPNITYWASIDKLLSSLVLNQRETMNPPDSKRRIAQLKNLQAWETNIARILGGWLPGIRLWEAKHEVGLHLWQDLQTAREIRTRLWELRVNRPDTPAVNQAVLPTITILASAQHDFETIAGCYLGVKQALVTAYRDYLSQTHATWDAPSIEILTKAAAQKESQIEWAKAYLSQVGTSGSDQHLVQRWIDYTRELISATGGVTGDQPTTDLPIPPPGYSTLLPFGEAKRDSRFQTKLQGFERPPVEDTEEHTLWQFVNYTMEMQAAETLGSVLWEVEGMDWEFYYDIARHCYDECRHCKMGEERVRELGHELHDFPQFIGNYAWRQLYDPMRRYAILTYIIEQDSFALKHDTYKNYVQLNDTTSAEAVLYDIIDETMHVRWGIKWVPKLIQHQKESLSLEEIIEECRHAVLENSLSPAQRNSVKA